MTDVSGPGPVDYLVSGPPEDLDRLTAVLVALAPATAPSRGISSRDWLTASLPPAAVDGLRTAFPGLTFEENQALTWS